MSVKGSTALVRLAGNPTCEILGAMVMQEGSEKRFYARVVGEDLDGKEVVVEGTELMARCLQHEVDHLDGHLYLDRLERSVRKKAMRAIREQL